MTGRAAAIAALAVLGALLAAPPAPAQTAAGESVTGRSRPEYQPHGIRLDDIMRLFGRVNVDESAAPPESTRDYLSSFLVNTRVELDTGYEDNLFREDSGEVSDLIVRVKPSFTVRSDWANHAAKLTAGAVVGRHLDNPREDFTDINLGLGGTLEIREDNTVTADLTWARGHEERASPDDVNQPEPTIFTTTSLRLRNERRGGVLFTRLTGDARYSDFIDNGPVNNDDRDRLQLEGRGRLGYEVDEGSQAFVEAALNTRIYDDEFDDNGAQQGSHGYEILTGVHWDVSGVTFAEFGAGYLVQRFDEPAFETIDGVSFNGKVIWNTTGLVTMTGSLRRSVSETTQEDAAGILVTDAGLTVDWEARYNLIVSARAAFKAEDFRGNGREDDTTTFGLKVKWLLNENWYLGLDATRVDKDSNFSGESFRNHGLFLTIGEQL